MAAGSAQGEEPSNGVQKATMVAVLGVERARAQANMLAEQAVGYLDSFGATAQHLRALARFMVERKS